MFVTAVTRIYFYPPPTFSKPSSNSTISELHFKTCSIIVGGMFLIRAFSSFLIFISLSDPEILGVSGDEVCLDSKECS